MLNPKTPIGSPPLPISSRPQINIGTQVATWGFPSGYAGLRPMLSVGYLSGIDGKRTNSGNIVAQWVVNAAFNSGNSGGPLLETETGEVIGVVSSKLAQISNDAMSALQALQNQKSGFIYNATRPDGSKFTVSEGQVVAMVLDDLRRQVQLVIGKAVLGGDLRAFLIAHGVDP
jgi:S1-C subfamily serine protease